MYLILNAKYLEITLTLLTLLISPACTPGLYQNLFSSGNTPQISPSSTTVGANQNLEFQVTGGTVQTLGTVSPNFVARTPSSVFPENTEAYP